MRIGGDWAPPIVAALLLLALWEAVVRAGLIPETSIPPASAAIGELFTQLGEAAMWKAVGNTLQGWAIGLGLAVLLGVPAGILIGSSRWAYRALRVPIEFLRPIPSVALIPLAVLVYGTGLESKVFLATFASFWPMLIQTIYGVQDVDPVATDTARAFGLGRRVAAVARDRPERGPLHRHRHPHLLRRRADPVRHGRARDRLGRARARDQRRELGRQRRADVRADHRHRPARLAAQHRRHDGRAARAALASLTAGDDAVSVRTRKLLELAVEIAVPIALVALIWAYTESSDTFYYPPLGDVFEKFADNWLFERFGSDVWPSLRRIAFGYAIAVGDRDRGRHRARLLAHAAQGDRRRSWSSCARSRRPR